MSRIAKQPIDIPQGVEVKLTKRDIVIKGPKGSLTFLLNNFVEVRIVTLDTDIEQSANQQPANQQLRVAPRHGGKTANALAGTCRALLNNIVNGVTTGFEKQLELIGVGYRAQTKDGKSLQLSLGYSHPITFQLPEGVSAKTPESTKIVLQGIDKQLVGQVAAKIRAFRPPEPYKGKGIRYADEVVVRKETKKK